jgi:hypothetical protein
MGVITANPHDIKVRIADPIRFEPDEVRFLRKIFKKLQEQKITVKMGGEAGEGYPKNGATKSRSCKTQF